MKPLRNINDLQIWAKSSDYRALSDNASIEIKLNYFGGVELGSPQNEATAVTTTPTLRWASYPGASEYKVRVWDYTGDTKGTQIVDDNTTDVEYTISPALSSSTKYLWQIAQIGPINPIQQPITVSISGGSTLEQNGTRQLSVSTTNTNQGVTWSSQNEAIATVDQNGLVTYVSGAVDATVDIDATSVEDPIKSDTHTLTIVAESTYTPQDSRAGDEAFMQAFYDSTNGGNWHNNTGWVDGDMDLSRADIAGVTVDTVGGELRIVNFDMAKEFQADGETTAYDGNLIEGTLCPEWGNLTKCVNFNVKQNSFTGIVPDTVQIGSLLERVSLGGQRGELDLTWRSEWYEADHRGKFFRTTISSGSKRMEDTNEFSGGLPVSLRNATGLKLFEGRRQYFTGTLPSEWSETSLEGIFVNNQKGDTDVLGGSLPSEWSVLPLVFIVIGNRQTSRMNEPSDNGTYTGGVPQSWQDTFTDLANIQLDGNEGLTGQLPEFPNCTDFRFITFSESGLDDSEGFPDSYFTNGNNGFISNFDVSKLGLTSQLPQTISPITEPQARDNYNTISRWNFQGNNMTGDLPDWFLEATGIVQFLVQGNNFTGGFPVAIAENGSMRLIEMQGNPLGGALPDVNFGSSLYELIMSSCGFTGGIPASWESMATNSERGVWRWYIHNNELEGEIPLWVVNITDDEDNATLERFWIYDNKFTYKDILPNYQAIKDSLAAAAISGRGTSVGDQYKISPQKNFGNVEGESLNTGQTFSFDYSHRADATDDKQWTKDNIPLSDGGRISGATTDTLTITNLEAGDAGDYRLELQNNTITEIDLLRSNPITLTVT